MQQELDDLNRQAIAAAKTHMGALAWPTVALTALVIMATVSTLWLFAAGGLPVWAATVIYAALTYLSYTPLHEAVHGNINGQHDRWQWLNDLCGYLAAPIIMVPYASHKAEHFTHHRYTNQPGKDPDFVVSGMQGGPVALVITGFRFLWVQNSFLFREYWTRATRVERAIYFGELTLSLAWRLAFIGLVDVNGAWIVLIVGYLSGAFFTAYWFAYRPHLPYQNAKRYQNTNSLIMPRWMKPLEWFWLGQNLHSVHHLFPRVPFYRYHALHRQIEPILRAHGTPIIGVFSRQPIEADRPHQRNAGATLS